MRLRAKLLPFAALSALTAMAVPAVAQFSGVTEQFEDMRNSLGLGKPRPPMDFTERPPLVVPPSDTLPPPASGPASIGINDPDTSNRRKALTDSRRPVPPSDPGAGVKGLAGRTYLVDPPAGMRDASTLGPDPTSDLPRKAGAKPEKAPRAHHARRRTPAPLQASQ